MRKYHGTLVHRSRDADGPIEVVDDGVIRTLHFGNDVRQSSMALHDPVRLMLLYTQAMMSCLLFQPDPKRVLLIGLGGGSLAKFLLHHFPRCKVDAVERRAAVVKLAHGYFQLPETPRLRATVDDACEHLKQRTRLRYDLVFLDAYDAKGIAADSIGPEFLAACRIRLAPQGVLVGNLWGGDRRYYKRALANLTACFDNRPLCLPSEGTTNVITLSAPTPLPPLHPKSLPAHVRPLEERTGLKLGRYARALRSGNTPWWTRLLHG